MKQTTKKILSRSKRALKKNETVWIKCKVVDVTPANNAAGLTDLVHVAPVHARRVKGVKNPVLFSLEPTVVEH